MTYAEMMAGLIMLRGQRLQAARDEAEQAKVAAAFWASEVRRYKRAMEEIESHGAGVAVSIARLTLEESP